MKMIKAFLSFAFLLMSALIFIGHSTQASQKNRYEALISRGSASDLVSFLKANDINSLSEAYIWDALDSRLHGLELSLKTQGPRQEIKKAADETLRVLDVILPKLSAKQIGQLSKRQKDNLSPSRLHLYFLQFCMGDFSSKLQGHKFVDVFKRHLAHKIYLDEFDRKGARIMLDSLAGNSTSYNCVKNYTDAFSKK